MIIDTSTYRIKTGPGTFVEAKQVFAGVCNPRYALTNTVTAAECGLFVDEEGNDIAAANVLGHWENIRDIGSASGWTNMQSRPVPADVMERITAASEHQPARTT